MSAEDLVRNALSSDPEAVMLALDKADAEESLIDFIRLTWHVLEEGREFKEGWMLTALCGHLEAVERGEILDIVINIPPGCMKSHTTGAFFPAWIWGPRNKPGKRFASWSYSEALTIRDNRRLRKLITSPIYQALWGDRVGLAGDQNEKRLFENNKGGFSFASSVLGGGTGHRVDFKRIDDPHKVLEAESDTRREEANRWVSETLTTRGSDEKSATICVMQRVHERDTSGFLLGADLGFDHLCLPMRYEEAHPTPSKTQLGFVDPRTEEGEILWESLFPEARVSKEENALMAWGGGYARDGQLQQRPTTRGGGMFREERAQYVNAPEKGMTVRGWDLAASESKRAAFTAGVRLTRTPDGRIIVEDVIRFRGNPYEVKTAVWMTAEQDGRQVRTSIPQDPGQAGMAQVAEYARGMHGYDVFFSPETGDKIARAIPFATQWEAGNVYMVKAPWNDIFIKELTAFGQGSTYKDQVDATTRAYFELLKAGDGSDTSLHAPRTFTA